MTIYLLLSDFPTAFLHTHKYMWTAEASVVLHSVIFVLQANKQQNINHVFLHSNSAPLYLVPIILFTQPVLHERTSFLPYGKFKPCITIHQYLASYPDLWNKYNEIAFLQYTQLQICIIVTWMLYTYTGSPMNWWDHTSGRMGQPTGLSVTFSRLSVLLQQGVRQCSLLLLIKPY